MCCIQSCLATYTSQQEDNVLEDKKKKKKKEWGKMAINQLSKHVKEKKNQVFLR